MKRKPFIPIGAGTVADPECFICHARPGMTVVLPNGVRFVCESCLNTMPKNATKAEAPERELFCPVCGMKTTIVTFDATECDFNSKALDYVIGPYTAMCSRCDSFLLTNHPTPEAALDYWRDHAQTADQNFTG